MPSRASRSSSCPQRKCRARRENVSGACVKFFIILSIECNQLHKDSHPSSPPGDTRTSVEGKVAHLWRHGHADAALLHHLLDLANGHAPDSCQGAQGKGLAAQLCQGGSGWQAQRPPHMVIRPGHLRGPDALPGWFPAGCTTSLEAHLMALLVFQFKTGLQAPLRVSIDHAQGRNL